MQRNFKKFEYFFKKKHFILSGLPSFLSLDLNSEKINQFKIDNNLHIEDDWERMKMIFKKNNYGEIHPEIRSAISRAQDGAIAGAFLGGIVNYRDYQQKFIEKSDAKVFLNEKQALRYLAHYGSVGLVLGAIRTAPLFGLFMGGYSLFCSCFQVYRNKVGIIEYTFGGCCIGALFRIFYGLRGILVGGIIGGILGTIYGILYFFIQKLFGVTDFELKYAHYSMKYFADTNSKIDLSNANKEDEDIKNELENRNEKM